MENKAPEFIEVRGGNINNLKNIDVNIPLHKFVAISGPSGSGKSSLAMGILYAEGSRRYLDALSTYTRRRIHQNKQSQVHEIRHIPSAIALRQRPTVPSERSTVGSMSEAFNVVRLIFSRLGSTVCPNGHKISPSLEIAHAMDLAGDKMGIISCPICHIEFMAKSAEDFAFNSAGACPQCHGTGQIQELDPSKIIADENLSLADGAIASWRLPGRNFMPTVAAKLGVRIDVPFKDLTDKEKDIVLHGKKQKLAVDFPTSTGRVFSTENTLYENAYEAVYASQKSVKSDRAVAKINSFFHFSQCPHCHGTRLNPELLTQITGGFNIAQVNDLTLSALADWEEKTKASLPSEMLNMATLLFKNLSDTVQPLLDLGLDYLTLSRNGNTLSTGELQRIQLARTLRTETTGVLYVLDEPSIGLHPDNVEGLIRIFRQLISQGNSLVVVDHEVNIISHADWIIEMGPQAGDKGGYVIAQGTPADLMNNQHSLIGPYISGQADIMHTKISSKKTMKPTDLHVSKFFNLNDVTVSIPSQEITSISGFSGAGKTSLILESLVPAILAQKNKEKLPTQVTTFDTPIKDVVSIDAKPVGKNTRSTLATYTSIMTNLRKLYASLPQSISAGYGISYFSYNNKEGACANCGGQGTITLDIQYLPDMEETCPVCDGTRYKKEIQKITWNGYSIVDILNLSVDDAIKVFADTPSILKDLQTLKEIGLAYLHLGESTPSLSGGEAQRLKLAQYLNRNRLHTMFVFDEPSIGLHPRDVQVLLDVMNQLKQRGATVVIITHDLDIMTNSDYLIDLGPRGGNRGGRIMAAGNPHELVTSKIESLTLDYLRKHFETFGLNDYE
ncbi:ATP-binding cassette domain-containing protein [Alloscardovia theropitheci]|uniref:UvrABC system protein A n=1 Tax=Alloscardovia theropitheci TaxID=2496842 RepID=A0A4V2MU48_9BIFI|nr:ATP-binding cassette domain-containing protein [Alloscardovia theropitheci]TCD54989.1 ATP-binding cassette domain-containing protein [Alloscardovia theropitheci]